MIRPVGETSLLHGEPSFNVHQPRLSLGQTNRLRLESSLVLGKKVRFHCEPGRFGGQLIRPVGETSLLLRDPGRSPLENGRLRSQVPRHLRKAGLLRRESRLLLRHRRRRCAQRRLGDLAVLRKASLVLRQTHQPLCETRLVPLEPRPLRCEHRLPIRQRRTRRGEFGLCTRHKRCSLRKKRLLFGKHRGRCGKPLPTRQQFAIDVDVPAKALDVLSAADTNRPSL